MYICDETIDRFLKEDVPYIDLTTMVLGIGNEVGKITFTTRENIVLSGVYRCRCYCHNVSLFRKARRYKGCNRKG